MKRDAAFGVDIGGSGIKGARVDLAQGRLVSERIRIETPQPATPEAVLQTVADVVQRASWRGPVGCTFPGIVKRGVVRSANNLDRSWLGIDVDRVLGERLGRAVTVLNDADAAGLAEVTYGAGRNHKGVIVMLTFGTGIGSALLINGRVVANSELGQLEIRGKRAERRASERVRERKGLSWKAWAKRVQELLSQIELLLSPDLFIIGGGVSKDAEKFLPHLETHAAVVPAALQNAAGIVGAALAHERASGSSSRPASSRPASSRPARAKPASSRPARAKPARPKPARASRRR